MLPGSSGLTALAGSGNVALAKSPTCLQAPSPPGKLGYPNPPRPDGASRNSQKPPERFEEHAHASETLW